MQGIRCDQSAQNSVCSCQCTQNRGFVSATFGLVVGDDDNCPARIASRILLDVRGGVQQAARDIGAALESFAIERAFEFLLTSPRLGRNGMRKRVKNSSS